MNHRWHTAWTAGDIVVYRNEAEVCRLRASDIRRVIFVYRAGGESPGDLLFALAETDADLLWFAAETGFAGRVNFERLAFWAERRCIYWMAERAVALPSALRRSGWLSLARSDFRRLPQADFDAAIAAWPLEGPQTWDERKWLRIERNRPFAALGDAGAGTTLNEKRLPQCTNPAEAGFVFSR